MPDVILREITGSLYDAMHIVEWRNNPDNARWFPRQEQWTVDRQRNWYNEVYRYDPSQNLYFVNHLQRSVGLVGMTIKNGSGELERMMLGDKRYARGGYMRAGMRKLMEAYGLNHYWLRVMPDNEPTINFHKSNGFSVYSEDGGPYVNVNGEHGRYVIMGRSFDGYWPEVPVR